MTSDTPTPSRPAGRRTYKVNVRLSAPEKAAITGRAAQMGMKPAQFMRCAALTCPLPTPPSPAPRLLAPGGGRQKFSPPTLLGFAFVLALAVAMALLVSTEAEGTNSAHAAEEDVSPASPEIPAPSVEEADADLMPAPLPIRLPSIAPPRPFPARLRAAQPNCGSQRRHITSEAGRGGRGAYFIYSGGGPGVLCPAPPAPGIPP